MTLSDYLLLNRLFTRPQLETLISENNQALYRLAIRAFLGERAAGLTNREIIHHLYGELHDGYRNEYYFKNELFNLFAEKGRDTLLFELPVARSKADILAISHTCHVYEIKTELDSFARLRKQISNYQKAFPLVSVVVSPGTLEEARAAISDTTAGLVTLEDGELSEIIPSRSGPLPDKTAMFKILRKNEQEYIINKHYGFLPNTAQVRYFNTCLDLFREIPLDVLYPLFTERLRMRNTPAGGIRILRFPHPLRSAIYFSNLLQRRRDTIEVFLQEKYCP